MTSFDVPGARLATEYSDEHGRPVVQLHGLTSSRARDRVLDLDLGRGLSGTRLLRYDARGHGSSTGCAVPDDYRWPNLADDLLRQYATIATSLISDNLDRLAGDVLALADAYGFATFRLVGHDWGGLVAWWVASQTGSTGRFRTNSGSTTFSARTALLQPTGRLLAMAASRKVS